MITNEFYNELQNKKEKENKTMNTQLNNFLDNKDIQTGINLNDEYIMLVDDYKVYELIEKLHGLAIELDEKKLKLSEFMEYFKNIDINNSLDYSENYIYCVCCGQYAYVDDCGVNDEFYINDGEVICKNCLDKNDYIDYLTNNVNNCNVMLTDADIQECGYIILSNYDFNDDMYGGTQTNKNELETMLQSNNINFFYQLNASHMFGIYYTIAVANEDLRKTLKLLSTSQFSKFNNGKII